MKKIILKGLKILFLLNITFFVSAINGQNITNSYEQKAKTESTTCKIYNTNSEVSLDLFCGSSMMVMVILSSLLGTFFMKDELSGVFS